MPAIYPKDRRPLPIVYDSPVCVSIAGQLLDCPRVQPPCPGQATGSAGDWRGVLGRLSGGAAMVGTRASSGVVGVKCLVQGGLDTHATSHTVTS